MSPGVFFDLIDSAGSSRLPGIPGDQCRRTIVSLRCEDGFACFQAG
jgi:hypothetical protein